MGKKDEVRKREAEVESYLSSIDKLLETNEFSHLPEEEKRVLWRRVFAEISNYEERLIIGQRTSKSLERIVWYLSEPLLAERIGSKLLALGSNFRCASQTNKEQAAPLSEAWISFVISFYRALMLKFCDQAVELAADPYASHVLQTILNGICVVITFEEKISSINPPNIDHVTSQKHTEQLQQITHVNSNNTQIQLTTPDALISLKECFHYFCQHLSQKSMGVSSPCSDFADGSMGLLRIMSNPCSTHVLRSLLRSSLGLFRGSLQKPGTGLNSYRGVRDKILQDSSRIGNRHSKGRRLATSEHEELLLCSRISMGVDFGVNLVKTLVHQICSHLYYSFEPLYFLTDPYASPVLQILLLILIPSKPISSTTGRIGFERTHEGIQITWGGDPFWPHPEAETLGLVLIKAIFLLPSTDHNELYQRDPSAEPSDLHALSDSLANNAVGGYLLQRCMCALSHVSAGGDKMASEARRIFTQIVAAWAHKSFTQPKALELSSIKALRSILTLPIVDAFQLESILEKTAFDCFFMRDGCSAMEESRILLATLAEACLRVHNNRCYQLFVTRLLSLGLKVQDSRDHRHVWPRMLMLRDQYATPVPSDAPKTSDQGDAKSGSRSDPSAYVQRSQQAESFETGEKKTKKKKKAQRAPEENEESEKPTKRSKKKTKNDAGDQKHLVDVCTLTETEAGDKSESPDTLHNNNDAQAFVSRKPSNLFYSPVGCWTLGSILKFPVEAIGSFTMSFKAFLRTLNLESTALQKGTSDTVGEKDQGLTKEESCVEEPAGESSSQNTKRNVNPRKSLAFRITADKNGSRLLETLLDTGSPLSQALKARLVKAYQGMYMDLARNKSSAFVLTSFYKHCPSMPIKTMLTDELAKHVDELKNEHYVVYKICELHRYKTQNQEWTQDHDKKLKTRALFSDILAVR